MLKKLTLAVCVVLLLCAALPMVAADDSLPTDISLSNDDIEENQAAGTVVGTFSTDDPGAVSYSLTDGADGEDNSCFTVDGSALKTNAAFNFETKSSYSIRVRAENLSGGYCEETFVITVVNVNDAPVASDRSFTVAEDSAIYTDTDSLSASDEDGDSCTYFQVSGPVKGQLNLNTDGTYSYTPDADKYGTDSFTYRANDGQLDSLSATVSITLTPVDDTAYIKEGDAVSISAEEDAASISLTLHAVNVDDDPLSWSITDDSSNGSAAISTAGIVTYAPAANFNGSDSFEASLSDGSGIIDRIAVTVTVQPVNDAPVCTINPVVSGTPHNGKTLTAGTGVWNDDADGNPGTLSYAYQWQRADNASGDGLLSIPGATESGYLLTADDNGKYVRVRVTCTDGGEPGTQSASAYSEWLQPVNTAPVMTEASASGELGEDSTDFTLTLHATDADEDALTWSISSQAGHGTAAVSGAGAVTYLPSLNYKGTDSFTVTVSDGNGGTDSLSVSVTVLPVNDMPVNTLPPVVSGILHNGKPLTAGPGVWNDDADGNPGALSYAYQWQRASDSLGADLADIGTGGDSYLLTADDNGKYIRVAVTCTDGGEPGTQSRTAYSAWQPVTNSAPVISEGSTASFTLLEDSAGQELTLHATDVDGDTIAWALASGAGHGTASLSGIGTGGSQTFLYIPSENEYGSDSFTVSVSDGNGGAASITVNLTVAAVNDAPSFVKGANLATPEDPGPQSNAGWATNLSRGSGNENAQILHFVVTNDNSALFSVQPAISANGTLTYTPAANVSGFATVTAVLHDDGGTANSGADRSAAQTFTIAVTAVNDAPSFVKGGNQSVSEDCGPQSIVGWATALSEGAADESAQTVSFEVTNDNNGLFSVQPAVSQSGTLTFTPADNANGTATVTVEMHDDGGTANGGADRSAAQTFTIAVTAVNDAPVMTDIADFSMDEDETKILPFTVSDVDNAAGSLTVTYETSYTALLPKANITVSESGGERTVTVIPVANRSGTVTVTLTVSDSAGQRTTQSFTITVDAVNDAPEIAEISNRTMDEDGSSGPIGVAISDVDTASAGLTVSAVSDKPDLIDSDCIVYGGSGASRTITLAPKAQQSGSATITVTVSDGTLTASTSFTATVNPVNDAPTIENISNQSVEEDHSAGPISFTVGDIDNDASALTVTASTDNTSMIPRDRIVLGGSGSSRTLTISPVANKYGTAVITVTVRDPGGLLASDSLTLTVTPVNDTPVLGAIAAQSTDEDTAKSVAVTVSDVEDSGTGLTLSAVSENPTLLPDEKISFSGTGSSRTLTMVPADDFSGTATVTVTLRDSGGLTSVKSFVLTVNAVNDAPSFIKGANVTVIEDSGAASIPGWATDISAGPPDEAASQTVSFSVTHDNSTLFSVPPAVSLDGTLTFTPAADAYGSAEVTVTLSDDGGGSHASYEQTFTLTVTAVNDAPVAHSMTFTLNTDEDRELKGALLASDKEKDALTYTLTSNGSSGTVTLDNPSTGAFTYKPNPNSVGTDSFTFKVNDGKDDSADATVTIDIQGVNDPPVAEGGSVTTAEDTDYIGALSASDIDNTMLQYSCVAAPQNGTVSVNSDTGSYTYTPNGNFNGTDRFSYRVSDGYLFSNIATVVITVTPVNDVPTAQAETIYLNQGQTLHGVLKASDIEGNALTYSISALSNPANGTLNLGSASTGLYTFTPSSVFIGEVSFTFVANDGTADSAAKTVTIHVVNVNERPSITDVPPITFAATEDTDLAGSMSASDPDGDALEYILVSEPSHGTLTLTNSASGAFTYSPNSDFNGADRFTYKAYDGAFYTSVMMGTIQVAAVNDAPSAYDQYRKTSRDTSLSGNLIASDVDGDSVTYSLSGTPLNGSVTINSGGSYTFTPTEDYVGAARFSFIATDSHGRESNVATVYISVNGSGGTAFGLSGLNDRSMAEDTTMSVNFTLEGFDTATVTATSSNQGLLTSVPVSGSGTAWALTLSPVIHQRGKTVITVSVTGTRDSVAVSDIATFILTVGKVNHQPTANSKERHIDEDTVLYEFVTGTDLNRDALEFSMVTGPSNGTLDFESDGTFLYIPKADYYGTDSFTFKVEDTDGSESEPGTVTIHVRRVDAAPTAVSGSITTAEDNSVSGTLPASTGSRGTLSYEIVKNGSRGSAVITDPATGAFTYTPLLNAYGTDAFTFKIKGESGLYSGIATMVVTVTPVNDAPVAVAQTLATDEDQILTGFLKGTDVERSPLTFELADTAASKGNVSLNASTGAFTYTPNLNANGADSFTFKVRDGSAYSEAATITINIRPLNDTPAAADTSIATQEDHSVSGSLAELITDVDEGDLQTFERIQNGNKGTVTISESGEYTYVPTANANGRDYFSFRTRDVGELYSNVAIVTVDIDPVNDTPTITAVDTWPIKEDSGGNRFTFSVGDVEDAAGTLAVSAASDNPGLISTDDITFGGSGADRWMLVTPKRHVTGDAVITITVTDSGKDGSLHGPALSASKQVTVTVDPVNDAPTINGKEQDDLAVSAARSIDEDTSTDAVPFTVGDEESGTVLTLSAASSNTTLVPLSGIVFGGSGANRTITVTPAANRYGSVRITVYATDESGAERNAYLDVTVRPVNDAPVVVITPAERTINEDTGTEALYFTISDIDTNVESIQMTAVSSDESKVPSDRIVLGGNGAERTVRVTPLPDQNGDVVITLIANDRQSVNNLGSGSLTLHITPVNDAPTVGSVSDQLIKEDEETAEIPFTVNDIDSPVGELRVSVSSGNPALVKPDGISKGEVTGDGDCWLKLKPVANANGSALITVTISDGEKSVSTTFTLTVTPVNDAPTIGAIADQTILEEKSTPTITFSVGDIDNDVTELSIVSYSADTGVIPVENIIVTGNGAERTVKVTPLPNQNGDIELSLTVRDTDGLTAAETFVVHIIPVNDIPSFTKGSNQTVNEDCGPQTAVGWATGINKGQPNESDQILTFTVTTNNDALFAAGGKPAIDPVTGNLTFTPAADKSGTATVTVKLSDSGGVTNGGADTTVTQTFTIKVNPVNDVPSFTEGADQTVSEDCGAVSIAGWATAIFRGAENESGQTLTFSATTNNDTLFATGGKPAIDPATGRLTFTPKANANGSATVTVKLSDNGGTAYGGADTSEAQTFLITVDSVNDAPTLTLGANQTVNEDSGTAGYHEVAGFATDLTPGGGTDESAQTLTLTVNNNNNGLFSVQPSIDPATGKLSYTLAADANGAATVTVILTDSGGATNTTIKTFQITVNPVNDAPTLTLGANQTVNEDNGAISVESWATGISRGAENESAQILTFTVTNNNNGLFSEQPAVDATGKLTFTPKANAHGTATVTVKLSDNGGTAYGGFNASANQTFIITVNAVNDVPSFTKGANQTVSEDCGAISVADWAAAISRGAENESAQALTFDVTNNNNDLFSEQPAVDASGKLTFTPKTNAHGSATVTVRIHDDGGTAYGGVDTSEAQTFTITVDSVNDAPTLTLGANQTVNEDSGTAGYHEVAGFATDLTPGGGTDESAQTLTLTVNNNNNGLYSVQPSIDPVTGTLSYTLEPDANGAATVTVMLTDGGDGSVTTTKTFLITVSPVNDAPSFTGGGNKTVGENTGARSYANWAGGLAKGPANEDGQTLDFLVTNDNNGLFSEQPAVDATGKLTFTPKSNAHGSATVTVRIHDSGGTANGGTDTSDAQTFTLRVVGENELAIQGTVKNAETDVIIEGAAVRLLDVSGAELQTTATDANGRYSLTSLRAGRYTVEVTHPSYSNNSRMTEVSFTRDATGVVTEDFLMADFTLELNADPVSILGNGTDQSLLTATVMDKDGNPISGVLLTFSAESGTFEGGITTATTDADGKAAVNYVSEDLSGLSYRYVPVTVSVNDPVRKLYGSDCIYVTFSPGFVEGTVTNGNDGGSPVQGATVTVYKDFDGDGVVDFSVTQITGADGKYKIAIPIGNVDYDVKITKPVTVGGTTRQITMHQIVEVDSIGASGAIFDAQKVATGIIVLSRTNGSEDIVTSCADNPGMKFKLVYPDNTVADISASIDPATGIFTTGVLAPGAYKLVVVYEVNGQEIIAGSNNLTISANGEMNINEILIDPYGTITDRDTHEVLSGVNVKLYYYDTPTTLVPLPILTGFAPNNNANPQLSDVNGKYAFMVFPDTDYLIVATKDGYETFTSGRISVGKSIVLYDFQMVKSPVANGGGAGVGQDLAIVIGTERMRVEENSAVEFTVDYLNRSADDISDVTITAAIPDDMAVVSNGGGTVSGKTISWSVDELAPAQTGTLKFTLKAPELTSAGSLRQISVSISSGSVKLINTEDDSSKIQIMIYSNRYEGIHERYIKGYTDGTFRLNNKITRAETAAIFARLLKLDVSVKTTPFIDVTPNYWGAGYISAAAKYGLIGGYDDGTFSPDQAITRAEFATMVARYFQIERSDGIEPMGLHFSDIDGNWAEGTIEEVYRYSIVNGYEDGTFRPDSHILRSEAVTMINRMLYRGPVGNGLGIFPDVTKDSVYFGQVVECAKTHKYTINPDGFEIVTEWIEDDLR